MTNCAQLEYHEQLCTTFSMYNTVVHSWDTIACAIVHSWEMYNSMSNCAQLGYNSMRIYWDTMVIYNIYGYPASD